MKRVTKRKTLAGVTVYAAGVFGTLWLTVVCVPSVVAQAEQAKAGGWTMVCLFSGLAMVIAQAQIDRGTWRSAAAFGGAVGVTAALLIAFATAAVLEHPIEVAALKTACVAAGAWTVLACAAPWFKAWNRISRRTT